MATNPSFVSTPRLTAVNVAAANTAVDGSGTITSLITGVAAGTRILEIDAQIAITGASAASIVNIFLSQDSGSTWRLIDQITMVIAIGSNTVKTARNIATYSNLILPGTTYSLGVTTTIAQSINVFALAGDLT